MMGMYMSWRIIRPTEGVTQVRTQRCTMDFVMMRQYRFIGCDKWTCLVGMG